MQKMFNYAIINVLKLERIYDEERCDLFVRKRIVQKCL